jgi:hypothetical protein
MSYSYYTITSLSLSTETSVGPYRFMPGQEQDVGITDYTALLTDFTFYVNSGMLSIAGPLTGTGLEPIKYHPQQGIVQWQDLGTIATFANLQIEQHVYFDEEVDNGSVGTESKTIDWTHGNKQKITLTGNPTLVFTAPSGICNIQLKIVQGVGNGTVTFPATVTWIGVTPTLSTGINAVNFIVFYYDGTTYWGGMIGAGASS